MLYAQVYYFHSFTQHFSTPSICPFLSSRVDRLTTFLAIHSFIISTVSYVLPFATTTITTTTTYHHYYSLFIHSPTFYEHPFFIILKYH
jgi:hypothetical protein